MSNNNLSQLPVSFLTEYGSQALIDKVVDAFYSNMLDDHRINRFFYSRPIEEQTTPLKAFIVAALNPSTSKQELSVLLDHYFTAAFARGNAKPSLVSGRDFGFLLDIVGGQEIRTITLLCPAHSHLMKLDPHDYNYDDAMEILANTLQQLNISLEMSAKLMALAESARDGLMGRGQELFEAA